MTWLETIEEAKNEIIALREINADLLEALKLAQAHLEYCGYGDKYERDCAREEGLPNLIEQAIRKAEEQS